MNVQDSIKTTLFDSVWFNKDKQVGLLHAGSYEALASADRLTTYRRLSCEYNQPLDEVVVKGERVYVAFKFLVSGYNHSSYVKYAVIAGDVVDVKKRVYKVQTALGLLSFDTYGNPKSNKTGVEQVSHCCTLDGNHNQQLVQSGIDHMLDEVIFEPPQVTSLEDMELYAAKCKYIDSLYYGDYAPPMIKEFIDIDRAILFVTKYVELLRSMDGNLSKRGQESFDGKIKSFLNKESNL